MLVYFVMAGDSYASIADKLFGDSRYMYDLQKANGGKKLEVAMLLLVPTELLREAVDR